MTDRPVIFSGPMIRALLEGRKTQTRRSLRRLQVRGAISDFGRSDTLGYDWHFRDAGKRWHDVPHSRLLEMLPWAIGDRLWVREGFAGSRSPNASVCFRASHEEERARGPRVDIPWRSSIHMPRWASRLTLIVTDVRVQRLQDISEDDACAEGLIRLPASGRYVVAKGEQYAGLARHTANARYADLWDNLHGQGAWASDPWVVAITFTVERRNIDACREAV